MGKGAGKGGALLGKNVKGKSSEKRSKPKIGENVTESELKEDIKMLEEYEKLNRLAEAQRARLKKLQQQETYNTRINKKLLVNIHRKFMRADKVDQLRKEIEILAQNHEREVDRKDAIVQMLTRDMDDAEEQFQTAQRTHMVKMNTLSELHKDKFYGLLHEFDRDMKTLKTEFNDEKMSFESQHTRETKEMKGIISAVTNIENDRIASAKQEHETEREEIRNKNLEGINELRINLENKIEDLEKLFDVAHVTYVDYTDQTNKRFKELQRADKKLSQIIDTKKRKIERMQANLVYWKKKIETNQKECVARNQAMKEQKELIAKHCNVLKQRMLKSRSNETKRLSELSLQAREAQRASEESLGLGERILQLAELGRKLETEREKVQPYYESTVQPNKETEKGLEATQEFQNSAMPVGDATMKTSSAIGPDGEPVGEWGHLENFHKKYNKVLLDQLAIAEEKRRLQKENSDLRSILKQYLDGIAITEDVVDSDNPLLVVNGRVNLLDRDRTVRRTGRPTTITESTQVIRTNALMGVQ